MHLFVHISIKTIKLWLLVVNLCEFVFLTQGETLGETAPGFPRCPCDPAVPGRAGVWCSTPSEARTPSPLSPNTAGWCSWNAAAAPMPGTATCPSQMLCPARKRRTVSGRLQGNLYTYTRFPPLMFYCNHVFISNSLFYQIQRLLFSFLFYYWFIIYVHVWFIIFSVIYKVLWVGLSSMKVLRKQKQFVTALNQGVYLKYCLGNKTIFIHSPWFLEAEK